MKLNVAIIMWLPSIVFARGGREGDGGIFIGLVALAIGWFLSKIVGEKLIPNGDETLQMLVGFFTILFGIALLGQLFK
jgi:hypothetical protein